LLFVKRQDLRTELHPTFYGTASTMLLFRNSIPMFRYVGMQPS